MGMSKVEDWNIVPWSKFMEGIHEYKKTTTETELSTSEILEKYCPQIKSMPIGTIIKIGGKQFIQTERGYEEKR